MVIVCMSSYEVIIMSYESEAYSFYFMFKCPGIEKNFIL